MLNFPPHPTSTSQELLLSSSGQVLISVHGGGGRGAVSGHHLTSTPCWPSSGTVLLAAMPTRGL